MSDGVPDDKTRLLIFQALKVFEYGFTWSSGYQYRLKGHIWDSELVRPGWYTQLDQLEHQFRKGCDFSLKNQNRFVFLRPIAEERALPLLTIKSEHNWSNFRAYILMLILYQDGLRALPLRFETDEGGIGLGDRKGKHDFCHVQLCKAITIGSRLLIPQWLPERQPSIPLDADDQLDLVFCMLVALYGARVVRADLGNSGNMMLRKRMNRVRALKERGSG